MKVTNSVLPNSVHNVFAIPEEYVRKGRTDCEISAYFRQDLKLQTKAVPGINVLINVLRDDMRM